jgi:hypothetical protein
MHYWSAIFEITLVGKIIRSLYFVQKALIQSCDVFSGHDMTDQAFDTGALAPTNGYPSRASNATRSYCWLLTAWHRLECLPNPTWTPRSATAGKRTRVQIGWRTLAGWYHSNPERMLSRAIQPIFRAWSVNKMSWLPSIEKNWNWANFQPQYCRGLQMLDQLTEKAPAALRTARHIAAIRY